jgi:hypothetical protein
MSAERTVGVLTITRALAQYLSVLSVSSRLDTDGETVATIAVLAVPPNEFFNRNVSMLLRYGTWLSRAASAWITWPRAVSDWLMSEPSSTRLGASLKRSGSGGGAPPCRTA